MVPITVAKICHDPQESPLAPWGVSITSEQQLVATASQVVDLTQVRGWIECPDEATADEIIRRLTSA